MKCIKFLFLFILITKFSYPQEYKIKGKIIFGQFLRPVSGLVIGFDSINYATTQNDGLFELAINEKHVNDTLQINLLSFYKIKITNFPKDSIIDLGTIPLFEYYMPIPIVSFDCRRSNYHRKKFWKNYAEEKRKYFDKMDIIIGYYRLYFKGKYYSIDIDKNLIDLSKPIVE